LAVFVEGLKTHAVRMHDARARCARHQLAEEAEVLALVEFDGVLAKQYQLLRLANRLQARLDHVRVDQIGQIAFEAEQHRLVRAMPFPGRAERAKQFDLDAAHEAQQIGVFDMRGEAACSDHRPDRVRAGGTDADLEQIEDADVHGVPYTLRYLGCRVWLELAPIAPHVKFDR
jgi:hypothetical protein